MGLIDTHCHIHMANYQLAPDAVIQSAGAAGVEQMICVGTDAADSQRAVAFVADKPSCRASVGLHPHDAKSGPKSLKLIAALAARPKVVAIGECGLDYYYQHSPKNEQETALRNQIELALKHKLPLIFHIRSAFADFWPIFDSYSGVRGVVHSFSAGLTELEQILSRGLMVGLNGIMTFSSDQDQLTAARAVPLDRLVLETDAPFLTPVPHRGKVNEPRYVALVAEFLANLRQEAVEDVQKSTTKNAAELFKLEVEQP